MTATTNTATVTWGKIPKTTGSISMVMMPSGHLDLSPTAARKMGFQEGDYAKIGYCLLYTSDAADE